MQLPTGGQEERLKKAAKPTSGGQRVKSDGVEDMAFQRQLKMESCGLACGGIEVLPGRLDQLTLHPRPEPNLPAKGGETFRLPN